MVSAPVTMNILLGPRRPRRREGGRYLADGTYAVLDTITSLTQNVILQV